MKHFTFMSGAKTMSTLKQALAVLALTSALATPVFANELPFSISVDGQKVDGSGETVSATDNAQAVDAQLAAVDIQVKFDGLGVKPVLNVSTIPPQVNFRNGETVRFLASLNYAAWVQRAEVRIYDRDNGSGDHPFATVPISNLGAGEWMMPSNAPAHMDYVLRVYDEQNRFDETRPLPLGRSTAYLAKDKSGELAVAPGYGEDRTAVRNIPVYGGAVTVYGKNVPEGHNVRVAGEPIPVDSSSNFVVQRIFPPGNHAIDVSVLKDGLGLEFSRDIEVPENEWFYVGLADFTLGHNFGGIVEHTGADEFPGTWTKGRLAFYLKGKIKGQYLLTAAADTGEGSLQNMFRGLDGKSPQDVLRHIDPNSYYPVYGDDSTAVDDAPTRGKFYLRLEKGPSSVMWGNFKSNITGSHFLRSARTLYGGNAVYRSEGVTKDGEAKLAVDAYAALPGTVPQNDTFRGTGGSSYFLKHQLVSVGSEIISTEQRNPTTGFVTQRVTLVYKTDYDIDYTNGVLILRTPLPSSTNGNDNYLVVHYEYEPAASSVDGYVSGGRAQVWAGEHVRFGVSGLKEKTAGADQLMYGADIRMQKSKDTYVEAEVARSEGPGIGSTYSVDGGLSSQTNATAGVTGVPANAWRVEGAVSLDEMTDGKMKGRVGTRYEHYDAAFSSLDVQAPQAKNIWGLEADVKPSEATAVKGQYSEQSIIGGERDRQGNLAIEQKLSDRWIVQPYARYAEATGVTTAGVRQGTRGDVGAKLTYVWDKDTQAYVFAQTTLAHSGTMLIDDRMGVGAKKKLTDRIEASGEISNGTQGIDATAALSYAPNADDRYSLGYRLDATRKYSSSTPYALSGADLGTMVLSSRHRFNDEWMAFGEDNVDLFGDRRSVTQTYGVKYTPSTNWALETALEMGHVYDNTINPSSLAKNPDIDRKAISAGITYREEGLSARMRGEVRFDNDGTNEVINYLFQEAFDAKISKDWRALGKLDAVIADATDSTRDGKYLNAALGFAYRGFDSDRFNMLAKYNFVLDQPGSNQVGGSSGTLTSPWQISHILSVDGTYDLTQKLSIGAKYGLRLGETLDRTPGSTWTDSTAHLGILRADYHFVNEWDAMLEGRVLWSPTSQSTDYGLVAAVYRQLGDNFKIGVGYNFGKFSDDLSHIEHDNQGVFINLIGKF
ncbi:MAG: TonB-dependent receptor [Alphaproteobacteria bacterium]|nr:TonB-dependent receptor [Alphaproteobacteria bacterium]